MRKHHLLTAGLLFLLLAAAPNPAGAKGDSPPAFGEIVDVRVVNLEAVVTEDGEKVSGLTAEDFSLLVDGQDTPIEYFSEVSGGRAVATPGGAGTLPTLPPGEAVGTRFLVFVDDYFAIPSYRNRLLKDLAEQLPFLAPEDRMAIVAFDGYQVEMLSSWTRSLPQLQAALTQAQRRRAYGLQRRSEQRQFDTLVRSNGRFGGNLATADGLDLQRGEEISWQVARVVGGATSALRAFARPQGRKVMLLVSGGWPFGFEWVTGGISRSGLLYGNRLGESLFRPLVETANRLGYTLYPIDLNNSQLIHRGSAEYGNLAFTDYIADRDFERDWTEEDSLVYLADATGGLAFLDGARNLSLERVVEDTRSYYWIGFTPDWLENDERHQIKLVARKKGMKVRSRRSFSDLSRRSENNLLVESAQLFDLPLPGGELGVTVGSPDDDGFRKMILPVRLEIPLELVTVIPQGEGYAAHLEMRIAATDSRGAQAPVTVQPVEIRGNQAPDPTSVAVFDTQLRLRRKPHRVLISVYDPLSGHLLSKRFEVDL